MPEVLVAIKRLENSQTELLNTIESLQEDFERFQTKTKEKLDSQKGEIAELRVKLASHEVNTHGGGNRAA